MENNYSELDGSRRSLLSMSSTFDFFFFSLTLLFRILTRSPHHRPTSSLVMNSISSKINCLL